MKIAVAGATGRVGRHVVDILEDRGHDVVPIARSTGVDVITGDGLAEALAGAEVVVDLSTGPTPDEEAATEFFTTAARNLQERGREAGVQRMVVVSIVGHRPVQQRLQRGQARPGASLRRRPDPGPDPARDAVPRVRRPARRLGPAGRRRLRAEDAHAARRRPDRRRGARRPGRRPRRGARPGARDRGAARGEHGRGGEAPHGASAATRCASRASRGTRSTRRAPRCRARRRRSRGRRSRSGSPRSSGRWVAVPASRLGARRARRRHGCCVTIACAIPIGECFVAVPSGHGGMT